MTLATGWWIARIENMKNCFYPSSDKKRPVTIFSVGVGVAVAVWWINALIDGVIADHNCICAVRNIGAQGGQWAHTHHTLSTCAFILCYSIICSKTNLHLFAIIIQIDSDDSITASLKPTIWLNCVRWFVWTKIAGCVWQVLWFSFFYLFFSNKTNRNTMNRDGETVREGGGGSVVHRTRQDLNCNCRDIHDYNVTVTANRMPCRVPIIM